MPLVPTYVGHFDRATGDHQEEKGRVSTYAAEDEGQQVAYCLQRVTKSRVSRTHTSDNGTMKVCLEKFLCECHWVGCAKEFLHIALPEFVQR